MDPKVALQLAIGDFRQHATLSSLCLIQALHELRLDASGNVAEAQLDEIEGQMLRCALSFARLRAKVRAFRRPNSSVPLPHAQVDQQNARRRPVMIDSEYLDRDGNRHSYKVPSRHFLDEDGAPLKGGYDE